MIRSAHMDAPRPEQLRTGYHQRPRGFPQSVVLCGVRDVRDYRIHSGSANAIIAGGSAFNVKAESLRLGDFSRDEVLALLGQHTAETGQAFTAEALELVWGQTLGQPWLVNALADDACFRDKAGRDRSRPIDAEALRAAQERLILRRETHLDQLADKLERLVRMAPGHGRCRLNRSHPAPPRGARSSSCKLREHEGAFRRP